MFEWSAIIMGAFYVVAGINHFLKPKIYEAIMPPSFPAHRLLVYLSGVAEIVAGLLVIWEPTRTYGAWAVIALLIAVFPANVYMAREPKKFKKIPRWALYLRLPLQGLLIGWAALYL